jgi:hypothetical protein
MISNVKKKSNNYISLRDAAKHCSYSQEYLSLRARQGKLKAIKIGRNWATKKDWLKKYLSGIEKYNNNLKNKKAKKTIKAKKVKIKVKKVKKKILPARRIPKGEGKVPKNLPVGEIKLVKIRPFYFRAWELIQKIVERKLCPSSSFRFKFTWAVAFILIIAGAVLGRGALNNIFEDISFFAETFRTAGNIVIEEGIVVPVKESFSDIRKNIKIGFSKVESEISKDQIYSAAVYDTIDIFGEYVYWLGDTFRNLILEVKRVPAVATAGEIFGSAWRDIKKGYFSVSSYIGENFPVKEHLEIEK